MVFYVFGAFLVWTAVRQAFMDHEDEEKKENAIIRFLRKRIPITDEHEGGKLRITRNGARVFTPVIRVHRARHDGPESSRHSHSSPNPQRWQLLLKRDNGTASFWFQVQP
jgi:hypothetical protein